MNIKMKRILSLSLAGFISLGPVLNTFAAGNIDLVAGSDRIQTSITTALKDGSKIDYVVLANAYSFADSLSSVNILNSHPRTKLILIGKQTDITGQIRKINPKKVFIVGGTDSISDIVLKGINNINIPTERISGQSRYETNAKTLEGFKSVGVADGRNYPDALSASPLLKKERLGLMLVNGSKPYRTGKIVKYTFGDKSSIIQDGGERLAGTTRYETNEKINTKLADMGQNILTYGGNYADALSAVNLLDGSNKIVLLNNRNISSFNAKLIRENTNLVVGGLLSNSMTQLDRISRGGQLDNIDTDDQVSNEYPNSNDNDPLTFSFDGRINSQKDLDRYILARFVNGIETAGESVRIENDDVNGISTALSYIIEDTGFVLKAYKGNDKVYHYWLKPGRFTDHLNGNRYNKKDFVDNLNHIRNDIRNSGALNEATNYGKYRKLTLYSKRKYFYRLSNSREYKENSSSPYALWQKGTASCAAFTYYSDLAAMLMRIPSFAVLGMDNKGDYHTENVFLDEDGQAHQINTTGVPVRYKDASQDIIDKTLEPSIHDYYYISDYKYTKDRDFYPKRLAVIKADFYK